MDPALAIEVQMLSKKRAIDEAAEKGDSEVQQFYKDTTLLISGGTGFMGKQMIEKLFRSCDIKKVFLLLRPKKKKSIQDRLNSLLADPVFDTVKKEKPGFEERICPIEADVAEPRLGISDNDRATIIAETDIIIHGAATVNFNEPLRVAVNTNVRGTVEMLNIGKECPKLKEVVHTGRGESRKSPDHDESIDVPHTEATPEPSTSRGDHSELIPIMENQILSYVHISTAFAHATISKIEKDVSEKFYDSPISPAMAIEMANTMDEERLNNITPNLIGDWPNTYTFTKAIGEEACRQASAELPISIFRPAVVIASYLEPSPGYLDRSCVFGPSGFVVGTGLGLMHTFQCDADKRVDLVPVDYVNNAIIATAWLTVKRRSEGDFEPKIYTFTSIRNSIVWSRVMNIFINDIRPKTPSAMAPYAIFVTTTSSNLLYFLLSWLWHYIPGYIFDTVLRIMGRKPMAIKLYTLMAVHTKALSFFTRNMWEMQDKNLQELCSSMNTTDKALFNSDITTMKWEEMMLVWALGCRRFILRDNLQGTVDGVRKQFWLKMLHYFVVCPIYFYFLYKVASLAFTLLYFVMSTVMSIF